MKEADSFPYIFSSNNFNFLQYFPLHMDCNKFDTFSVSHPCVDVFVVEVCVCACVHELIGHDQLNNPIDLMRIYGIHLAIFTPL